MGNQNFEHIVLSIVSLENLVLEKKLKSQAAFEFFLFICLYTRHVVQKVPSRVNREWPCLFRVQ